MDHLMAENITKIITTAKWGKKKYLKKLTLGKPQSLVHVYCEG